jgi:hypothetical protein
MRFIIRSRLFSDAEAMQLLGKPVLLGDGQSKVV